MNPRRILLVCLIDTVVRLPHLSIDANTQHRTDDDDQTTGGHRIFAPTALHGQEVGFFLSLHPQRRLYSLYRGRVGILTQGGKQKDKNESVLPTTVLGERWGRRRSSSNFSCGYIQHDAFLSCNSAFRKRHLFPGRRDLRGLCSVISGRLLERLSSFKF